MAEKKINVTLGAMRKVTRQLQTARAARNRGMSTAQYKKVEAKANRKLTPPKSGNAWSSPSFRKDARDAEIVRKTQSYGIKKASSPAAKRAAGSGGRSPYGPEQAAFRANNKTMARRNVTNRKRISSAKAMGAKTRGMK